MVVGVSIVDKSYSVNAPYFKNESYVEWLESFTIDETVSDISRRSYHELIDALWTIPFRANLGNDIDRAEEGLELRNKYNYILSKKAGDGDFITPDVHEIFGECRVLEMLVALSMRMYDVMMYTDIYNSVSKWFWTIMRIIGFDTLDDDNWVEGVYGSFNLVCDICSDIMDHREYFDDGTALIYGGWFGVHGWQRMEIWYQMHAYLQRYF